MFPALIWAAVRFGQQGATLAVACAVGMTVWRTAHHTGPFVQHSMTQTALSSQLYIAVAALTTLCLGAIVSERQSSAWRSSWPPRAARSSAPWSSAIGSLAIFTTRSRSRSFR